MSTYFRAYSTINGNLLAMGVDAVRVRDQAIMEMNGDDGFVEVLGFDREHDFSPLHTIGREEDFAHLLPGACVLPGAETVFRGDGYAPNLPAIAS